MAMLLTPYVQAATPCVAVNTHEDNRFMKAVVANFKRQQVLTIAATGGLRDVKANKPTVVDAQCSFVKAFQMAATKQDTILLVFDLQHVLQNAPM